jgi:hypothetical protein
MVALAAMVRVETGFTQGDEKKAKAMCEKYGFFAAGSYDHIDLPFSETIESPSDTSRTATLKKKLASEVAAAEVLAQEKETQLKSDENARSKKLLKQAKVRIKKEEKLTPEKEAEEKRSG